MEKQEISINSKDQDGGGEGRRSNSARKHVQQSNCTIKFTQGLPGSSGGGSKLQKKKLLNFMKFNSEATMATEGRSMGRNNNRDRSFFAGERHMWVKKNVCEFEPLAFALYSILFSR